MINHVVREGVLESGANKEDPRGDFRLVKGLEKYQGGPCTEDVSRRIGSVRNLV